jgi:aryl-phospho-beta-D-glucosidase BglC (GH1 family)
MVDHSFDLFCFWCKTTKECLAHLFFVRMSESKNGFIIVRRKCMETILENRRLKHVTIVFLFMLFTVLVNNSYAQYTTKGQDFINKNTGGKVILRGFGLGCWLLPEGYMLGIRKIDRPWMFEKAIKDLIGEKDANEFWHLFYENYLTEEDVAAMKSWGANSLRIPILATVLQPREGQPDRPPYKYSEYGFGLLDKLVKWCSKYEIEIIWDMHAAPGGQNAENISDSDGEARLWTEKEKYWPMCIELWYKIAERYKNEKCIIGYDLLNEPLLIRYKNIRPNLLREIYVQLTDTIRTVDSEGIIFIEGDDWAQTFDILEPMDWDKHLAMAFHSYPPTSNQEGLQRWDVLRQKYNIPLWHGETGEQGPPYKLNIEATTFLESANVSWSWWTHKKFDIKSQPWSCVRSPGFLKILDYWNGVGEKPSKEQAKAWLFEQAKMTNSDYCEFYPDMVRSLIPLDPDKYLSAKVVTEPKIVTQPENISAEAGGVVQTMVRAYGFPLHYQWYKNGLELTDQDQYRLYVANPSITDNNSTYVVKISNSKGTVESKKITLSVIPFTGPVIHFTSVAPIIDANPDEVWEQVQPIALRNLVRGENNSDSNLSALIKLLWDDTNLYLWAQITDDVMSNKNNKTSSQDALELFLDPDNTKPQSYGKEEYHLRYVRNNSVVEALQGNLTKEIIASQKNVSNGYQMELAIPWAAIHGKPSAEKFIGIDVHVIDNDNERRSSKIAWSGKQDTARRSPMTFGTMKIGSKK